jgi:prepilin peptidase CpaA
MPDALCLLICLIATYTDLKEYRIPNWLTLSGVIAGLLCNTILVSMLLGPSAGFFRGFVPALAGSLLLFLTFAVMGAFNLVAMGDVKLMAAVGACLRWPTVIYALLYVLVAGGVLGIIISLLKGRLAQVLRNILRLGAKAVGGAKKEDIELHRIPYALAILVGANLAAAIKYYPQLALF